MIVGLVFVIVNKFTLNFEYKLSIEQSLHSGIISNNGLVKQNTRIRHESILELCRFSGLACMRGSVLNNDGHQFIIVCKDLVFNKH